MAILSSIGRRAVHIESPAKVTGQAKYRYAVAHFAGATVTQQAAGAPQAAITSQASIEAPATEPQQSAPAVVTAAFGKTWMGLIAGLIAGLLMASVLPASSPAVTLTLRTTVVLALDADGSQGGESFAPFKRGLSLRQNVDPRS